MPNVKPGDLARVIADNPPHVEGIAKMQVLVIGLPSQYWNHGHQCEHPHWEVEALESRDITVRRHFAFDLWEERHELLKAGDILCCCDSMLRRIDPPADVEDVFKPEALPHELKDEQHAKA